MQGRVIRERYELLEQLGKGGMGSVWRANDRNLCIEVAVKLIQSEGAESPEARARFEREALAAAQLRSTHIVLITDHGVDANTPFIVMELLRGESLAKRLEHNGRLTFEQTLACFIQIGDALAFAHERKIVHRDLKPDNVFIVSERNKEVVKVLDFGVAKRLDAQSLGNKVKTHTGTLLGTPYYMSPEQTRGIPGIDHRTDLWSFGVMAYECLTGRRPFDGATLPDLLMAICRDPCPPPSQVALVPLGFDAWFAKATAREREDRFGSIEEALEGLSALQGAPFVGTTPVTTPNETTAPTHLVTPIASPATVRVKEPVTPPRVKEPATPIVPRELEASPHGFSPSGSVVGAGGTFTTGIQSVVPSSVTAPGVRSTPQRKSPKLARIWSLPALGLSVAVTGYALWPNSSPNLATASATSTADGSPTSFVERQYAVLPSARVDEQPSKDTGGEIAQPRPGESQSEAHVTGAAEAGSVVGPNAAASAATKSSVAQSTAPAASAATKPSLAPDVARASKSVVAESAETKPSVALPNVASVTSAGAKPSAAAKPGKVPDPSVAARTQAKPTQPVVAAQTLAKPTQSPAPTRSSGANAARSKPTSSQPGGTNNSWGL